MPTQIQNFLDTLDPTVAGFVACFGAALVLGLILVLWNAVASSDDDAPRGKRLRRTRNVFDRREAKSVMGKVDQGFDRLVLESGLGMPPASAFLGIIAVGLLVGGITFLVTDNELAAISLAFVGMLLTLVIVQFVRARRMREIRETLPSTLDLLARAVRAGESLDQAIHLAGKETRGPLGRELAKSARQIDMGMPMKSAMRSLANRVRVVEMRIFASTLTVHRETGGNLAWAMDRLANVIRERLAYQRQMRASTGAGRSSAYIIITISVLAYVGLFLWMPEHFRILWEDPMGRTLLIVAAVLEVIGILWIWRLMKSD